MRPSDDTFRCSPVFDVPYVDHNERVDLPYVGIAAAARAPHLGGARRRWPLTGLAERAAEFEALTSDARSGHVSVPTRPQPQSAASDQRPAISKHAPSGWLGYRELLQFSTMMIFLATTEAAATVSHCSL